MTRTRQRLAIFAGQPLTNKETKMIFRTADGKFVGIFASATSRREFVKTTKKSVHMLREPESWAIDAEVVKTLEHIGCKSIMVKETEENVIYRVDFPTFIEKAIDIDRGYGAQKALPLIYWNCKLAVKGARFVKYEKFLTQ